MGHPSSASPVTVTDAPFFCLGVLTPGVTGPPPPVVTGLIGVGGRIGGVLGAAFLERPRVFPRIFRKTATGRYRETERQEP